jgi:uncharacterized protein YidB (DUF937 family)/LysM repeat protein
MSYFTDIVQRLTGGDPDSAKQQSRGLVEGLLDMLQDESGGGIDGIQQKFRQHGLGDLLSSWIGTGQNRPMSPDQVVDVLGRERVEALSQRAGIPETQAANVLSQFLPELIDKLTPEGRVPQKSQISTLGKVIIGGLGAALAARAAASLLGNKDEGKAAGGEPAAKPAPPIAGDGAGVPSASAAPAAQTGSAGAYTVAAGDTLSKIAKHHYGDANQWPRIFEANRDVLSDPNRIFPGQVLRIP